MNENDWNLPSLRCDIWKLSDWADGCRIAEDDWEDSDKTEEREESDNFVFVLRPVFIIVVCMDKRTFNLKK